MSLRLKDVPAAAMALAATVCSSEALSSSARAQDAAAGTLTVSVGGLRNTEGDVCITLFDSAGGFPDDAGKAVKSGCYAVTGPQMKIVLEGLKEGTYAFAIIHDENKDGKLNTGAFGIPKEGFGFSNNPPIRIGAPKFSECAFTLGAQDSELSVKMRYL